MTALVELVDVSKRLNDLNALDGVTLSIGPGLTVLTGMSGAGKSTLMRIIAGLIEPDTGSVTRSPGLSIGWLCAAAYMPAATVDPPAFPALAEYPGLVLVEDITFGMPRSRVPGLIATLRELAADRAVVTATHRSDLPAVADMTVHLRKGVARCSRPS